MIKLFHNQNESCYCLENLAHVTTVPNIFCNGSCTGNSYQKCGSEEKMYHSIFYVGSYFGILNDQEGGIQIVFVC